MTWKTVICVLLLASVLMVSGSCGENRAVPRELRLSLILGTNSDWYRGALRFKELVEARTGGSYRISIYPHAQLAGGVQRTELEMVQTGVIDFSLESSILLSLIEERMSLPSLPWLFRDYEQARRILDGPLGRELLELLPPKKLVGLAYGANGFRQITNSRNPVLTPADITAMKVRVPAIRLYIDVFKQLGADPSSMNFGELFPALAQGTMDGQENPAAVIFASRLHEVQKYLTVWNYSYDPIILCVNSGTWNSLSPDVREVIRACAREAMEYQFQLVAGGELAALDSLRSRGMVINSLSEQSLDEFRHKTEPIYEALSRTLNSDILDRFRAAAREGTDP